MKMTHSLKYILGVFLLGSVITACDKYEEDVPPARMAGLYLHDDAYTTLKNQAVQLHVLANDTVGSAATLQYGQPMHGTIQTNANGGVFYHPASNFTGSDTLVYKACLDNTCATATVRITVQQDSASLCVTKAFDDVRTVRGVANGSSWDTVSVLRNDNLCGNSGTTLRIVQQPAHGQASVNSMNQIQYFSTPNYAGADEITYAISNANGNSTAKLRLNVSPPICAIKANPDSAFIYRVLGTIDTVSVKLAANDVICPNGGPVNVQLLSQPTLPGSQAFLSGNGAAARVIYMTSGGKNMTDIFQYRICQGNNCSTASVTVRLL